MKKSTSPNPNLRTFNMFEGVKQPSYSRTKTRSLSPMPSSHPESTGSSTCSQSPVQNKSLSPQPHTSSKKRGNIFNLWTIVFYIIFPLVTPLTDSPSPDIVALSKRSRTQVYSGKRSGSAGKCICACMCVYIYINCIVLQYSCRCSHTFRLSLKGANE